MAVFLKCFFQRKDGKAHRTRSVVDRRRFTKLEEALAERPGSEACPQLRSDTAPAGRPQLYARAESAARIGKDERHTPAIVAGAVSLTSAANYARYLIRHRCE